MFYFILLLLYANEVIINFTFMERGLAYGILGRFGDMR